MKENRVKIVIKQGKLGFMYCLPVGFNACYFNLMLDVFRCSHAAQKVEININPVIYEMHRDKYNNLIYREYEKK